MASRVESNEMRHGTIGKHHCVEVATVAKNNKNEVNGRAPCNIGDDLVNTGKL